MNLNRATRLKILICTESFHPYTSGIARRFKEIIIRLAKHGHRIHVITGCKGCESLTNEPDTLSRISFSRLFALEFKNSLDCSLPFLLPQYGILKAILDFKPDVIHCVEHSPAATFCASIAICLHIPIVWSSHTNLDYYIPLYIKPFIAPFSLWIYQKLRRTFLNLADYNLTVSSDFAKLLVQNGIKHKVHVWKTGVDSKMFNPAYRSQEMRVRMFNGHYAANKILLVSVGRLSPEKKFEFLLEILNKFPQAFLCIVGGGPYIEHLKPLFPPNQAHFIGFLQGTELASAYASADYFVYASVSETFGQVYLEAMSSGIPIVAAEGKQMKEFFEYGVHGYTWKPDDVDDACQALQKCINNKEALGHNCRQNALNHSWNSAANQIEDIYLKIKKSNEKKFNPKGLFYFLKWFVLQIMILLFMVPFMNVAKPANKPKLTKLNPPIPNFKFCISLLSLFALLGLFINFF
ncbi:glycosyl transferase [Brachionus plicatilis]|uniref:Glycosyl transferase n=1 Tax=Brachionus plicatilis TaxID=10195 RepID=A0A3M7QV77_BRAPC|nr:glycosyl transferase [Brachionus plicatilis]